MSAELVSAADGNVTVRFRGKLNWPELAAIQQKIGDLIHEMGHVRILCLAEEFAGWDKSSNWGDVSFQSEYDPYIEKIAIVGDRKWEDLTYLFTAKGFRKVPIEFFSSGELSRARAWLEETTQRVSK